MKIQVQLFARARDLVGSETVDLELASNCRVADLRTTLCEKFPALNPISSHLLFAVDCTYVGDDAELCHPEVACFPPVSGG